MHYKVPTKTEIRITFAVFPTLPQETFPLVISSPEADPPSPGSNTRYSGIHCLTFHILSQHAHSLVLLFWQWSLAFRKRKGNLPCFEGMSCDNTALPSQIANSKKENFLHGNTNAKISGYDHTVSVAYRGNSLSFSLSYTRVPTDPQLGREGFILSLPEWETLASFITV